MPLSVKVTPSGRSPLSETVAVGVPVVVGGITVYQGDLLHGDRNGVTTIPHEVAGQVADGVRLHPLCSRKYLEEVCMPQMLEGMRRGSRSRTSADFRPRTRRSSPAE